MVDHPIVQRPRLAAWIFERAITRRKMADELGCSYDSLRRYCLPFGDADRRVPDEETLGRIVRFTGGEITAADFYPPELNGVAPAGVAEAAA